MFNNIGGKIKGVCSVACTLGIICSCLLGVILLLSGHILPGVLTAALFSLLFWLSSLALYGFGQLVENSDILAGRARSEGAAEAAPAASGGSGKQKAKVKGPIPPDAVIFPTRVETEIKCPRCGFAQIGYRDLCRSCKAPFFYQDELE